MKTHLERRGVVTAAGCQVFDWLNINDSGHNHGGKETISHCAPACLTFWTAMEVKGKEWAPSGFGYTSTAKQVAMMSYHQLWEHVVQLIVSWHRQCWLHGLQGKILPQPVGDLRVIAAVKTAEDKGEAAIAATATFSRSHGCRMRPAGQVGRVGGSLWASLEPPPPQSLASVRDYCGQTEGTPSVRTQMAFRKIWLLASMDEE